MPDGKRLLIKITSIFAGIPLKMEGTIYDIRLKFSLTRESNNDHVNLIQRDIGGGTITKGQIDEIAKYPNAKMLSISGLKNDTFEYLAENYGNQFEVLNFFKCPLLPDISPMEKFSNVAYIIYYWNQRATRLWDFSKTTKLVGLQFQDFSRLRDLSDLAKADSVSELVFGNAIWTKSIFDSLQPVGKMKGLKDLSFTAKQILDESIEGLSALRQIKSINCSPLLFDTVQFAWLKAKLPEHVESEVLKPCRDFGPFSRRGKNIDVQVIGKGKPTLDSQRDAKRLEKYVSEFQLMVAYFREHVKARPNDYPIISN